MPSGNPGVALQHDDVIERKKVENLKTKFLTTLIHIKKNIFSIQILPKMFTNTIDFKLHQEHYIQYMYVYAGTKIPTQNNLASSRKSHVHMY
jgi:hypothetical protein